MLGMRVGEITQHMADSLSGRGLGRNQGEGNKGGIGGCARDESRWR